MTRPAKRGRPRKQERRANGQGSVYWDESKQRWIAAVDGHKRRFATRDEAEQGRLDMLRELDLGINLGVARTVAQLAQAWLEVQGEWEVSTLATTTGDVQRHIIDAKIGKIAADRLRVNDVQVWLKALAGAGYSKASIRTYKTHLSGIYNWALRTNEVRHNPASIAKMPAGIRRSEPKRSLTYEQAQQFVEWCSMPEEPWGPFFLACVMLGLRPGEACGLRWSRINTETGTILIDSALKRTHGAPSHVGPPKDEKHVRTVEAPTEVMVALERRRATQAMERSVYADEWTAPAEFSELVFTNGEDGRRTNRVGWPCHQSNVRKQLDRVCHNAGVPRITPYELRHSCASILLGRGMDVANVATMMGTSEVMLRRHYQHLIDPVIRGGNAVWLEVLAHDG